MHNLRRTLEQRWRFHQATVISFVEVSTAFDSVDRDSPWRIMAADSITPKVLSVIKAYCSLAKMKVRASGNEPLPVEIRSGVRK